MIEQWLQHVGRDAPIARHFEAQGVRRRHDPVDLVLNVGETREGLGPVDALERRHESRITEQCRIGLTDQQRENFLRLAVRIGEDVEPPRDSRVDDCFGDPLRIVIHPRKRFTRRQALLDHIRQVREGDLDLLAKAGTVAVPQRVLIKRLQFLCGRVERGGENALVALMEGLDGFAAFDQSLDRQRCRFE